MTLMFSDTQRIMNSLNYIHEVWAAILETAVATWLLYRQTGSASFAMLAVSISECDNTGRILYIILHIRFKLTLDHQSLRPAASVFPKQSAESSRLGSTPLIGDWALQKGCFHR